MMRVSSRLAGWAVAASVMLAVAACEAAATAPSEPAAGRPAGVSEGLRAAVVVAVVGAATVQPSKGAAYPAGPDQELLADDTIVTAADGFVMLELHNGHVVRVRSGDGLRVDKTAAFGEPAAAGALVERLAAALSPDETADPRLQVAARVAGWNMRMTSARTFGAQREPKTEEPRTGAQRDVDLDDAEEGVPEPGSAASADGGSAAPAAPAAPADPPAAPSEPGSADPIVGKKKAPKKNTKPVDSHVGGSRPRPEPSERDEPSPQMPEPAPASPSPSSPDSKQSKTPEPEVVGLDLPESVDFRPEGGASRRVGLPGPLKARRAALAQCAGKGVQIRGQVKGGKLVKLEFPGADRCSAGIVGGKIALEDGWLELRVKP